MKHWAQEDSLTQSRFYVSNHPPILNVLAQRGMNKYPLVLWFGRDFWVSSGKFVRGGDLNQEDIQSVNKQKGGGGLGAPKGLEMEWFSLM
jgi:hypothetical protein